MNAGKEKYYDLTVLGQIGETRQTFLRKELDVRTFKDLAEKTPEEIAAVFQANNKPISQKIIEQWIEGARNEAKKTEKASVAMSADSSQVQNEKDSSPADSETEWEWLRKVFLVEFRVLRGDKRIKKREMRVFPRDTSRNGIWVHPKDVDEETPQVLTGDQLYPWMVQQLGDQSWPTPEADSVPEESIDQDAQALDDQPSPVRVAVKQINAYPPKETEAPIGIGKQGHSFEGSVEGNKPFDLEVVFELPDLTEDEIVKRDLSYRASFFVQTASEKKPLGDTKSRKLEPGKVHKARLSKVILPPASHRLGVIVKVRTKPSSLAYLVTPEFQVI
jgi:hypothetical protein